MLGVKSLMSHYLLRGSWAYRLVTVIKVESQLHGYRQGHQLLAASATLPKLDQSVVDRLSDVAGPLRSGEIFAPYLSAYPLPSGIYYVLARTWQDFSVQRAGCVRTLSLLIPAESWSSALGLKPFLELLGSLDIPSSANQFVIPEPVAQPLPPTPNFRGSELLEALFLEDTKPIVVLDAPDPELIVVRLLTALWPSIRKRFTVSTFALSPRRIEGRDFDLVFAPKSARSKFSDWSGRRLDGRTEQRGRHRWTGSIVDRVFCEPIPRLLGDHEVSLIGPDESDTGAALRIALLWDELLEKLDRSPSAALGLLDIANSRKQIDPEVFFLLKSALSNAARRAVATLPEADAWQFISAMARKMYGTTMASEMPLVAVAAGMLAEISPAGAVAMLDKPDPQGAIDTLATEIANGLGRNFGRATEKALLHAQPQTLAHLLAAGSELAQTAVNIPSLIHQLGKVLPDLSPDHFGSVKRALLPLLIENVHLAAAQPLLVTLGAEELLEEVDYLASINSFGASSFIGPLVERARQIGVISALRDTLLTLPSFSCREEFLCSTLTPTVEDILWLFSDGRLGAKMVGDFLVQQLRAANADQFRDLFGRESVADAILARVTLDAPDVLTRAVSEPGLPLVLLMATTLRLLPVVEKKQRIEMAFKALERGLREQFAGNECATISMLLGIVGEILNGGWAARCGLGKDITAQVLNRNLVAFYQAPEPARMRIVEAVDEMAQALESRPELDLEVDGAHAFAQILWRAEKVDSGAMVSASGRLIPLLLRSTRMPVSSMIAATFPIVYRELAKHDNVPDILKFISFFDWDRCKAARRELVDAFTNSSVWRPDDLVLTACLCSDVERILRRTAKSVRGDAYINHLAANLSNLPIRCQEQAKRTIFKIRSESSG